MRTIILLSTILVIMSGCKSMHQNKGRNAVGKPPEKSQFVAALPRIVVYKTTNDYRYHVPVLLSDDKMQIVSYPHPSDLFFNGNLALPSPLNNDYFLDNRGINQNVAFLKYTYEEYTSLANAPSLAELYESIIDKNPLLELWDCGEKTDDKDLQKTLNDLIDSNKLAEKCSRIK